MSLLNFPPEVTLQFIQKMNLFDRINLSLADTRLAPLCFDRSLNRNSTDTITLDELRQLYEQSSTENERDQLFKSNVLDKLLIKNFNVVVRLYMDPTDKQLVANGKILNSLKGKFVLEGEREKFSTTFIEKFLCLLERAEGTLLLVIVHVERLGIKYAGRCAQILSNKLEHGQKVYFVDFCKTLSNAEKLYTYANTFVQQIINCMKNFARLTIYYRSVPLLISFREGRRRCNFLSIDKRNSVNSTKELIAMINADSLPEAKQHLEKVLALVEVAALPGGGRRIECRDCYTMQHSNDERLFFWLDEPLWSNCTGCALK